MSSLRVFSEVADSLSSASFALPIFAATNVATPASAESANVTQPIGPDKDLVTVLNIFTAVVAAVTTAITVPIAVTNTVIFCTVSGFCSTNSCNHSKTSEPLSYSSSSAREMFSPIAILRFSAEFLNFCSANSAVLVILLYASSVKPADCCIAVNVSLNSLAPELNNDRAVVAALELLHKFLKSVEFPLTESLNILITSPRDFPELISSANVLPVLS